MPSPSGSSKMRTDSSFAVLPSNVLCALVCVAPVARDDLSGDGIARLAVVVDEVEEGAARMTPASASAAMRKYPAGSRSIHR